MKPLVLQSIEDESGDRCVDIIRQVDGQFTFRECRKDPEDAHGWRHLSAGNPPMFESADAAIKAAQAAIGWMARDQCG